MQKFNISGVVGAPQMTRLGFVSSDLDRHAELRARPDALEKLRLSPKARFIGIAGDAVCTLGGAPAYQPPATSAENVFLGLDPASAPWFAYRAAANSETTPLRAMLLSGHLPQNELSRFAQARSLVHWHESHGFCATCGTATVMADAGYRRRCPACQADHFPRTDPVVIMAITDGDHMLLGRQAAWTPGMYSALAGFMEPGETIEQAVRRETWEEAGVKVGAVHYVASQPWPFPASLMIGVVGRALERALNVDGNELEDARWFAKDEVKLMLARKHPGQFHAAHPYAIAHHLITAACAEEAI
jgi:NAD+ diphosphatase